MAFRWRAGEAVFGNAPEVPRGVALLALFCALNVVALALLGPGAYFRYLAPLVPAAFLLVGCTIGALARRSRPAAVAAFALWLFASPIRDFVHEITHDFDGPIEGIVRFLENRAQAGDTVAISYGDMPLKFYTDLRVLGGLTGEDLAQAAGAEWIILRKHTFTKVDREVKQALIDHVEPGEYVEFRIRFPDTAFENRPDPRFHRYRTAPSNHPRVVIYGRQRNGDRDAG